MVFVCGGVNIRGVTNDAVRQLLRQCAAGGAVMGALCTGSFALASAGLLDGYRCAIHWENLAAISEEFPKVRFAPEVFILDRDRMPGDREKSIAAGASDYVTKPVDTDELLACMACPCLSFDFDLAVTPAVEAAIYRKTTVRRPLMNTRCSST